MWSPLVVELSGEPPLGPLVAVVQGGRVERVSFDAGGFDVPSAGRLHPDDLAVADELRSGVVRWLATGDGRFDVTLDLDSAGPFRSAVYRELCAVPAGERVTYGELAVRAGHPGAARAVGRAMATNPWPLLVPCHRVVPAGRATGRYAGGAGRKAWMLAVEAAGGVGALGGAVQAGP